MSNSVFYMVIVFLFSGEKTENAETVSETEQLIDYLRVWAHQGKMQSLHILMLPTYQYSIISMADLFAFFLK